MALLHRSASSGAAKVLASELAGATTESSRRSLAVSLNANTPVEVLTALANDDDSYVRMKVGPSLRGF